MRRVAWIGFVAVFAACSEPQPQADTDAAATPAPATPAALSLADLAGTWNVQAMPENSDSVLISFQMVATSTTDGWSYIFPDRPDPVPVQVLSVSGDSIVLHAGPYPSALRAGQQVTTHGVLRLQNGAIVGRTEERYSTTGADSLVIIRTTGTRAN